MTHIRISFKEQTYEDFKRYIEQPQWRLHPILGLLLWTYKWAYAMTKSKLFLNFPVACRLNMLYLPWILPAHMKEPHSADPADFCTLVTDRELFSPSYTSIQYPAGNIVSVLRDGYYFRSNTNAVYFVNEFHVLGEMSSIIELFCLTTVV